MISLTHLFIEKAHAAYRLTDSGWQCTGFLKCGSGTDAVTDLIGNLIGGVLSLIGLVATLAFFYGAIRMVASQGQEGKEAGKKALIWASAGLVAALLTAGIMRFVCDYLYLLGGGSGDICEQWWI